MAVLKVIEVMASSKKSWEDAAMNAVKRTAKTVDNIRSVYIKDHSIKLTGKGEQEEYRVNCKITFEVGK